MPASGHLRPSGLPLSESTPPGIAAAKRNLSRVTDRQEPTCAWIKAWSMTTLKDKPIRTVWSEFHQLAPQACPRRKMRRAELRGRGSPGNLIRMSCQR
jgi:hypothetical protein